MPDKLDIAALVKTAESGQGCALQDQLRHMPFEQMVAIEQQMVAMNAQARLTDKNVPPLYLETKRELGADYATVRISDPGSSQFSSKELFQARLQTASYDLVGLAKGHHRYTCDDIPKEK